MHLLKCDLCDGSLTMNARGDFATCDYCGVQYSTERLQTKIQEITGVVEVTRGEKEKERLLKNADTFVKLEKYHDAIKIYKTLQTDYPDDYRAWYGEFETYLTDVINREGYYLRQHYKYLDDLVETAIKLCEVDEEKNKMLSGSSMLWQKYVELPNTKESFLEAIKDPYEDSYLGLLRHNAISPEEHIYIKQINEWYRIHNGFCRHCGGPFKGIFSLKCSKCGYRKDY